MGLAQLVKYKPQSHEFFRILRWKQKQSGDGRREVGIGEEVNLAATWEGHTEAEICQMIVDQKPGFKRITGLLPPSIGLTRAIMAASIETGSLSDKDLIIMTPTLEELGLLQVQSIKERWAAALKKAEDQRSTNIAKNVKNQETKTALEDASDQAIKKAITKASKDLRVYVMVDKSGSMQDSIRSAKECLAKFLQGFPLERVHVSAFNTYGKVIDIKHASAAGVEAAFRGEMAGGGTLHSEGVRVLQAFPPKDEEDVLFIFVGDQAERYPIRLVEKVRTSGLRPSAFAMLQVGQPYPGIAHVEEAAAMLEIPCFHIDPVIFDDPYAVVRTLENLIASTPVGVHPGIQAARRTRKTLVQQILEHSLLTKPAWA